MKTKAKVIAYFDEYNDTFCMALEDEHHPKGQEFVAVEIPADELFDLETADLERKIGGSVLAFLQLSLGRKVCGRDYAGEAQKVDDPLYDQTYNRRK